MTKSRTDVLTTLLARSVSPAAFAGAVFVAIVALPNLAARGGESDPVSPVAISAALDGRVFGAYIVREDAAEGQQLGDKLAFGDGMFSSALCRQYNFSDAPYWVRIEGEQIHFLVELNSPTDGTMLWKGTIRGDSLEGTMRWTKKRWYWTIDTEHKIHGNLENPVHNASNSVD